MTIILHDLCFSDDIRPSPYCWRTRLALSHKGLDYRTEPCAFTAIPAIAGGGHKTVPVLEDRQEGAAKVVGDSTAIADYLEAAYPDRPALFAGPAGRAYAAFLHGWMGL